MRHWRSMVRLVALAALCAGLAGCTGSRDEKRDDTPPDEPTLLAVGAAAPDFAAEAHDGTQVRMSELRGQPVVLYFYPKDDTPG